MKARCGLIGKTLGHSYSKEIHAVFGDYEYELYGVSEREAAEMIKSGEFRGLNVTIPYKELAYSLCDVVCDDAREAGSVNTIVYRNGKICGYNTDIYGFEYMLKSSGIDISGKNVLILGSGGTSKTVKTVARRHNARATVVSRSGEVNYDNVYDMQNTEIIINATPVGMYPKNGVSPVDLSRFPNCIGVCDVIYNPNRTALLYDAARLGIRNTNGLSMLSAQGKRASEIFFDTALPDSLTDKAVRLTWQKYTNVVLIGMPGSGKSTVGRLVADALGRRFVDTDEVIASGGKTPAEIICERGEAAFREIESEVVSELGRERSLVIATGGGVVEREENHLSLSQNGQIYLIRRDIENLSREGRPLSRDIEALYRARKDKYNSFADVTADNNMSPEHCAKHIIEDFLK